MCTPRPRRGEPRHPPRFESMPAIQEEAPADDMQLDPIVDLVNEGAAAVTMGGGVRRVCLAAGVSENEAGGVVKELFGPPRVNQQI